MNCPYILSENSLTVIFKDGPSVIHKESDDAEKWEKCIKFLSEQDWDNLHIEMNKEQVVKSYLVSEKGDSRIEIKNGMVLFEGAPVHNYVVDKIFKFMNEELDVTPLVNFLHRLMNNPSKHCIDQLYGFLEHGNMPVDNEGFFYAYKAVTSNFMDKRTNTIRNKPGDVASMPRRTINDDHAVGCSEGLHAGSINYVQNFANTGDKIVIVKIDPADVVTVPSHDTSKLRCCRYEVVQEYEGLLRETVFETEDDDELDLCEECGQFLEDCCCEDVLDLCARTGQCLGDCCCEEEEECDCGYCEHTDFCANDPKPVRHTLRCTLCGRFVANGGTCICQS